MRYEALGAISQAEARGILAQRVAEAGNGKAARSRVPFETLATNWKASVLPKYKHSTQKNHRHIVDKHLVPRFGTMPMTDVTREAIQKYVADLITGGYGPKTIDHIHDVLSAVLRTAVKWGHITDNPAHGVELPKVTTVRPKWALTTEQAIGLLEALPRLARTMVGLVLLSGIRRGELFALRWRTVNEQVRCLMIREAVYEGKFDTPKTEASVRDIPLADAVMQLMAEWRARCQRIGLDDLVFSTWSGKSISPNNVLRQQVYPACAALGLPRVSWLTLRRTYSSWAHDKGVPGKVIAQLMGHTKVDTTLNVYTR